MLDNWRTDNADAPSVDGFDNSDASNLHLMLHFLRQFYGFCHWIGGRMLSVESLVMKKDLHKQVFPIFHIIPNQWSNRN